MATVFPTPRSTGSLYASAICVGVSPLGPSAVDGSAPDRPAGPRDTAKQVAVRSCAGAQACRSCADRSAGTAAPTRALNNPATRAAPASAAMPPGVRNNLTSLRPPARHARLQPNQPVTAWRLGVTVADQIP